jgi:hypothetical protein
MKNLLGYGIIPRNHDRTSSAPSLCTAKFGSREEHDLPQKGQQGLIRSGLLRSIFGNFFPIDEDLWDGSISLALIRGYEVDILVLIDEGPSDWFQWHFFRFVFNFLDYEF